MGLMEVIEYQDPSGSELCHKVPEHGSGETRLGSQLVVRESQQAVFFRDGKGWTSSVPPPYLDYDERADPDPLGRAGV
jgi:membrane protease subunit (stomatin/prohibitin family)